MYINISDWTHFFYLIIKNNYYKMGCCASRNKEKKNKSLQDEDYDEEGADNPLKILRKYNAPTKFMKKKKIFEKIEDSINMGYKTG